MCNDDAIRMLERVECGRNVGDVYPDRPMVLVSMQGNCRQYRGRQADFVTVIATIKNWQFDCKAP